MTFTGMLYIYIVCFYKISINDKRIFHLTMLFLIFRYFIGSLIYHHMPQIYKMFS